MRKSCGRCGKSLPGISRITSILNMESICSDCKAEEQAFSCYRWAMGIKEAQVEGGNMNYPGVLEDTSYCLLDFMLDGRHFRILGEAGIEGDELIVTEVYVFEMNANGKSVSEFKVTASTFSGSRLSAEDALFCEIARYTQKGGGQKVLYMHDTVSQYINAKLPDRKMCDVNGRAIPLCVLGDRFHNVFELMFVTDRFIYYTDNSEGLIMMNSDNTLLSDNYFAEVGYWDSICAVAKGDEQLLYVNESLKEYIYEQLEEEGWIKGKEN